MVFTFGSSSLVLRSDPHFLIDLMDTSKERIKDYSEDQKGPK
jgi:hypothetical protein